MLLLAHLALFNTLLLTGKIKYMPLISIKQGGEQKCAEGYNKQVVPLMVKPDEKDKKEQTVTLV